MEWLKDVVLILSVLGNFGQAAVQYRKGKSEGRNIDAQTYDSLLSSVNRAVLTADEANKRAAAAALIVDEEKAKRRNLHDSVAENLMRIQELEHLFQNTERDYRSQMDEFKIACWEVRPDGKNHGANFTFLDITGLDPDEYADVDWLTTVCDADRSMVVRLWRRMLAGGDTTLELRFRFFNRKDPSQLTEVEAHVKACPLPSGRIFKYTARTRPLGT